MSDEAQVPEAPQVPAPTEERAPEPRRWTWPAKTAESFLIVISILVALAGDAWWDGRVERREERDALVALRAEFIASQRDLESSREVHRRIATAIHTLLQWTGPQPTLPAGDTVPVVLNDAIGSYATYNDRRGVLDGVIASGGLRLIQNDTLRAMLAGWPAAVEDLTEDEALAMELRNGELLPYVYRLVPMDGSRFPRDFEEIFADPYFERLLFWRLRQIEAGILPPYEVALQELSSILAAIEGELR